MTSGVTSFLLRPRVGLMPYLRLTENNRLLLQDFLNFLVGEGVGVGMGDLLPIEENSYFY